MCLTNLTGSFYATGPYSRAIFGSLQTSGEQASVGNFDLSRSSAIYRDEVTTVRPEAFRMLALVKAY